MSGRFPYLGEDERFQFPDPETANTDGILASGGNLSPGMLLSAYSQGIFPWFSQNDPILWWSPDPRFVIFPEEVHTSDSMKKVMRQKRFSFSVDEHFREVITACAWMKRPEQTGTWITKKMIDAYCVLHELGYAHSVEAWADGEIAGGLYGISLGKMFFGESMFSRVSNASKASFLTLAKILKNLEVGLIDSQVRTNHVASLGGRDIPRKEYRHRLQILLRDATLKGSWRTLVPADS